MRAIFSAGRRLSTARSALKTCKVVRSDSEQCVPALTAALRARDGCTLVELPEMGTDEDQLVEACAGAHVLLHCYTPVTRRVIEAGAPTLRAIVKYLAGMSEEEILADALRLLGANEPIDSRPSFLGGSVLRCA